MEISVCFDIGSTFTGYAYSSSKEYEEDMLNIHLNEEWMSGHANLHTYKVPSIALLQQDKTLFAYGYDAERKYTQLQDAKQQDMWYYFKRFKADLKTKPFRKDTVILEEGGKSMNGIALFTLVLKYLKAQFQEDLDESARYGGLDQASKAHVIKYVITVPTKWDQASRDCMKTAAKKAGIPSCSVFSESEAVERYCRLIPLRPSPEGQFYIPKPGSKHLIVNLGGTGIDTALQEIRDDRSVKEFAKNVGTSSGATRVDADFLKFVHTLFGVEFIELYSKKNRIDFLELQYEFEVKKRQFSLEVDTGTRLELPSSLVKMYTTKYKQSIQYLIDDTDYVGRILSQDEYMILDKTLMKDIFGPAVKSTVGYLTNLSRDPETKQCEVIIISGGFAQSPVVSGAARHYFPNSNLIIIDDGGVTGMRGGVLLGHNPGPDVTFKPKFSYGIGMAMPYKENRHPDEKLFIAKGNQYCSAVFKALIDGRRHISIGEYSSPASLSLNRKGQKSVAIPVYVARDTNTKYTSDDGCSLLGKIRVTVEERDVITVRIVLLARSVIVEGYNERSKVATQESFMLDT